MAQSRKQQRMNLMETLTSSLVQKEVLVRFYNEFSRSLVPADFGAFCVSKPGSLHEYDWDVANMPQSFFAGYSSLAEEDFVRLAVMQHPNTVLSDSEMLSREALKNSAVYAHSRRAIGEPLEHVMAVLLDVRLDWHGGMTLYRKNEHQPFTDQERMDLQCLTPMLASTVRNCRVMANVARSPNLLEALEGQKDFECIVMRPPSTEELRTKGATELLAKWFSPAECDRSGSPMVMLGQLTQLATHGGAVPFGQDMLVREKQGRSLVMTFVPLPEQEGRQLWALVLQEDSIAPQPWRTILTPAELRVTEGVLQGMDNETIAVFEGVSVNTIKTHLKNIYRKLLVERRAQLISKAEDLNAGRVLWQSSWAWHGKKPQPPSPRSPSGKKPR